MKRRFTAPLAMGMLATVCSAAAAPPRAVTAPGTAVFDLSASQSRVSDWPGPATENQTVRLAASLTQSLPRDWLVRASVNTQYSTGTLSLQEALAPSSLTSLSLMSHRDYLRDGGFGGNVELYSPNLCQSSLRHCRALLFYDRNYIHYNRNLGGQLRSGHVGSVGVGMRMRVSRDTHVQLDYGRVVRSSQMPDDGRNRLTLRLGFSW